MLATIQILIHLAIFLIIVVYKQRCSKKYYRASAGILAFLIGGFNLAMIGYLLTIQPNHAVITDYIHVAISAVMLGIVIKYHGSTSRIIDAFQSLIAK